MSDLIASIIDTPIPTIFVLVGVLLLLLAMGIRITTKVVTSNVNPKHSAILGLVFIFSGLALYSLPFVLNKTSEFEKKETKSNKAEKKAIKKIPTDNKPYDYEIKLYVGRSTDDADLLNKKILARTGLDVTYRIDYQNMSSSKGTPDDLQLIVEYNPKIFSIKWLSTNCKKVLKNIVCDAAVLAPSQKHTIYYVLKILPLASGNIVNTVRLKENIDNNDTNKKNNSSSAVLLIDEKTGKDNQYYNDGKLHWEFPIKNKRLNGKAIEYYKNGNIKSTWQYLNNKLNGKYIKYYKNKRIQETGNYLDGKLDSKRIVFYKNGNKKAVYHYKNDELFGIYYKYDKNGNKTKGEIVTVKRKK